MKGIKKLLTGILAATLIMGASITAYAVDETTGATETTETSDTTETTETPAPTGAGETTTPTVTIDNAIVGQSYDLYQLFYFEPVKDNDGNVTGGVYRIEKTSPWYAFVTGNGEGAKYVNVDANGYVSWKTSNETNTPERQDVLDYERENNGDQGNAQKFAQAALEYAKDSSNGDIRIKYVTSAADNNDDDKEHTTVTFSGLSQGYYLVDSGAGALVGLNTLSGTVITIHEKNDIPTVDKEVKEKDNFQKQNDAEIGDVVEFKTTIAAKAHGEGYVLYDQMAAGLTFKNDVKVYHDSISPANEIASSENTWQLIEATDTTPIAYPGANNENATFKITFNNDYTKALKANTDIIVTYSAQINGNAVKNTAIPNKTILEYGNKSKSNESETKTYVWGIKVIKYTGTDVTSGKKLPDAEFVIYKTERKDNKDSTKYAVISDGKLTGWSAVDDISLKDSNENEVLPTKDSAYFTGKGASILKSDENGEITVQGLDAGEYWLLETKAPSGYNKNLNATQFVVISKIIKDSNNNDTLSQVSSNDAIAGISEKEIAVQNNTGTLLPSTGGIGTTIFYIIGGILIIAGVAYFIVRRKAEA